LPPVHLCLARGLGHGRPRQLHCTVPRLEKVSNLVAMCGRPDGQTARWPDESNAACGTRLERGSLLSSETQGSKPGLTTRPRDVKSNCSKTHHCRDWMCVGRTARNSKAPVTKGVTYACFVFFFFRSAGREGETGPTAGPVCAGGAPSAGVQQHVVKRSVRGRRSGESETRHVPGGAWPMESVESRERVAVLAAVGHCPPETGFFGVQAHSYIARLSIPRLCVSVHRHWLSLHQKQTGQTNNTPPKPNTPFCRVGLASSPPASSAFRTRAPLCAPCALCAFLHRIGGRAEIPPNPSPVSGPFDATQRPRACCKQQ
jgi:hypothetical protein